MPDFLPQSAGDIKIIEDNPEKANGMLRDYDDVARRILERIVDSHILLITADESKVAICPNCTKFLIDDLDLLKGFLNDCLTKYAAR